LSLASGQGFEMGFQLGDPALIMPALPITLERLADRVEHFLLAERFGQEIDGAGLDGLDRHGNVAVPGHEDDRDADLGLGELRLEVEAAQSRQPDVEHEAAHHLGQLVFQQVGRRPEQLDLVSNRSEQAAQRLAHGLVVVDNEYDRLLSGRDRSVHGNYKVRATWLIVPSYTHWPRRSMVSRRSLHHIALTASYLSLGELYLGMSLRYVG